jgi:hypothetical protein
MKMTDDRRDSIFEIVCYLVACARLTLDEAPRYGSQRLLVGASRLIAAAEDLEGAEPDPVLEEWKRSIDENIFKMALAYPEYVEWLSGFTRTVGRETVERNLTAPRSGALD